LGWNPYPIPTEREIVGPVEDYFGMEPDKFEKQCDQIISKTGADLGDANIYFDWSTPPSTAQLMKLEKMIEEIIKPFGNKYIIMNKN
jgi:hypothetical protein